MKIILVENEDAERFFEDLINRAAERTVRKIEARFKEIEKKSGEDESELWVDREFAKKILGVHSKKKMQFLRDHNMIRTSKHGRIIRYYKPSLLEFLEKNVQL